MAFHSRANDVPRDASAIDERYNGAGILVAVIMALLVAAAVGAYFLYAGGSAPSQRTINAPSTTQLSPTPAPVPATRPAPTP